MTQLTVSELIEKLDAVKNPHFNVFFDFASLRPSGGYRSYRGYYEQLALEYWSPYTSEFERANVTAPVLSSILKKSIGDTIHGYKGGDNVIEPETRVWASNYGEVSSTGIVDVIERVSCPGYGRTILVTAHMED